MTALVVVPAVEIRHRGPNIGHGLPVLTEGELIFVGPVEALQDSRTAWLGHLTAHPVTILQTALVKKVTGEIAAPITRWIQVVVATPQKGGCDEHWEAKVRTGRSE